MSFKFTGKQKAESESEGSESEALAYAEGVLRDSPLKRGSPAWRERFAEIAVEYYQKKATKLRPAKKTKGEAMIQAAYHPSRNVPAWAKELYEGAFNSADARTQAHFREKRLEFEA